jgi:hypothetical protein
MSGVLKLYKLESMSDIPDSAAERTSRWSEWRNRIISAIVGIAVAVVAALIIGNFQAREPHLTYSSTESVPFSGPNGDVSIYQVTLSNDGKKEVYDVACAIRIPTAKIDQFKLTADPLLNAAGSVSGDSLNVLVPSLNPTETIQVSLLASGSENLPARPQVAARGRGIVGSEKAKAIEGSWLQTIPLISLMAASLAVFASGLATRLLRSKSRSLTWSAEDQRQVLAYICRVHGLADLAERYSTQTHETTYWAEADRLGQDAIDAGGERMEMIEHALLALTEYDKDFARASIAIVYYNVALINRAKSNEAECEKYLQLAKDTSDDEIQRRLKVDPRLRKS